MSIIRLVDVRRDIHIQNGLFDIYYDTMNGVRTDIYTLLQNNNELFDE